MIIPDYYFGSKNEIYKETVNYTIKKITNTLLKVIKSKEIEIYLFDLTKELITFLEDNEEYLFLLLNI